MRAPVSRPRPPLLRPAGRRWCVRRRAGLAGRARVRPGASPGWCDQMSRPPWQRGAPAVISRRRIFLLGQRRLGVGVVLAAREQAPEQAGELAGGGDDRDRVPAAGLDALVERGDRAGLADGRPARFDERVAGAARALLGDVAVVGRRVAGLADLGIQAEVGGQLAAICEAADVADGGHEGRRDDDVDAGDGHQPLDLRPGQRVGGDQLLDRGDLACRGSRPGAARRRRSRARRPAAAARPASAGP